MTIEQLLPHIITICASLGGAYVTVRERQAKLEEKHKALFDRVDTIESDQVVTQQLAITVAEAARDMMHMREALTRIENEVRTANEVRAGLRAVLEAVQGRAAR